MVRLTAKERILLHLLDYVKFREAVEVPPEMTQEGLASAAWVELRHLSQYLRPLLAGDQVRERTSHVKGIRQRRKVYDLTDAGQHAAYRLRDRVKAETLRVRDSAGLRDESVATVLERAGGEVSLLELLRRSAQGGTLDLDALAAGPPSPFVEMLAEAPRLDRFVGRTRELQILSGEDAGPRIFVVRGVAGIGKSSIAARTCELLRGRCNLFWHTLRPWDTRVSVLTALGEFLARVGKPGLRSVVSRGEAGQAADVLREDLPGARCFLVFDDAQDASAEVLALFRFLKDAMAEAPDARALILTRRALGFYDRRDVSIRHLVREIELAGLAPEDVSAFLEPGMDAAAGNLGRALGGHPLFLQLVRSLPRAPAHESALRDMRRFLEEEVYGELAEPERMALKTASVYRVPVPAAALHSDPSITHDTLLSLTSRALLRTVGTDLLEVHDTLRSYFVDILTASELSTLGAFASAQLRSLASQAQANGNAVACIGYLSNALHLPATREEREALLENLADLHEKIGELPAAVTEYKEAAKVATSSETRARLHRKTASAFEARGELLSAADELELGRRALGDSPSDERGWVDLVACRLAMRKEDFKEARVLGRRALQSFQRHGDSQGLVRTYYALGSVELDDPRGDPSASERNFRSGLGLALELHDLEREVRLRTGLAALYANRLGDLTRTTEELRAIEANAEALRDPQTQRSFLMLQSWIHLEIQADFPAAERYFNETAALARKIHFISSLPATQYGLALSEYYQGRLEDARRDLEAFARDSEAMGFPGWAVEGLCVLAECELRLGDVDRFRGVVQDLGRPALAAGRKARPSRLKVIEAMDDVLRNDWEGARAAFDEALELAGPGQEMAQALELHLVHFYSGISLCVRGHRPEGADHLRRARECLERAHLRARLAILPETERQLTETLARSSMASTV